MTVNEKKLFFELCQPLHYNKNLLETLLFEGNASPEVLGHILYNRMAGLAFQKIKNLPTSIKIPSEFENALSTATKQTEERNSVYLKCVEWINTILRPHMGKYVMLKGAHLCSVYEAGCRSSNDIDLLVDESNTDIIGNTLKQYGFLQGYIINNKFKPATREDIIFSKMMKGETVPYIKEINSPYLKWLEIDINFSTDYKPGDKEIVSRIINSNSDNLVCICQSHLPHKYDFIIHLCMHLYKEATTIHWVQTKRDLCLYKFTDIAISMNNINDTELYSFIKRIYELKAVIPCYYSFYLYTELMGANAKMDYVKRMLIVPDTSFLHKVIAPREGRIYLYNEKNIQNRFWTKNRMELLSISL